MSKSRITLVAAALGMALLDVACASAVGPGSRASDTHAAASGSHPTNARTGASASSSRPNDTFYGSVTGTGAYRSTHGTLTVLVSAPGSSGDTRRLTLTFKPGSGKPTAKGSLTGRLARRRGNNPDTGSMFSVSAAGTLTGLGSTTVRGTIRGTGFTARGKEKLKLVLTGRRGTLAIDGSSPTVPGFSSP